MKKRIRGDRAEQVAADYLIGQWFIIRDRNRTIRGGELDIVGIQGEVLVIVEVRSVDHIDDLYEYMTPQKMMHLVRSTETYVSVHDRTGQVRLDVIFVQQDKVVERYQNVTNA